MSDDYTDFKGAGANPPISSMKIVPEHEWPLGAVSDGRVYSLECSRAMRALMADGDTAADQFELDEDGMIQWVPAVTAMGLFEADKPPLSAKTGTYAEIATLASRLNRIQAQGAVGVTWIYTPVLVEPQAVA